MKSCGETITDVMIMEEIMRSIPPVFDHIVVAIEESRDLEKLKIQELQSSFEAYEMRRRERNPVKHDDQALKIQHVPSEGKKKFNKWKGKNNGQKKWRKHIKDQEEKSDSSDKKDGTKKNYKKKDMRNVECFVCHKKGHFSCECWFNKDVQNKKVQNKKVHNKEAHLEKE